jgi:hypothetical protein
VLRIKFGGGRQFCASNSATAPSAKTLHLPEIQAVPSQNQKSRFSANTHKTVNSLKNQ